MRTFVILGIVLLVVSVIVAKLTLNHQSSANTVTGKNESGAKVAPEKIVCWGYFDVEPGVAGLYPTQLGIVTDVKPENTPVKKGDVLLQVDATLAGIDAKRARADVTVSEKQKKEAEKLRTLYKLQREQQESAIRAVGHEISALEQKRDRDTLPLDNPKLKQAIEKFYAESLAQLREKKKSEENKLEQLKLQDAELKIDQVEAELTAKALRAQQAEESLKNYQIIAPSNGTVLRVNVRKGETLGPNPRAAAIEFLPDADMVVKAEVLQEWGQYVKEKQEVEIEDDTYMGMSWKGTVKSISKWYAPTRSPVIEPFRYNDVRTLECIIRVESASGARIGQRVRAKIKTS